MVRAVQKQVDARPVPGQTRFDVLVHTSHVIDPVQAPCDPGLVGHHRDWDAGPVEPGNRLRRPFDELDPVDRAHVSVVDDYRAVTIKKDARPQWRAWWRAHRSAPSDGRRAGVNPARARRSARTHAAKIGHWRLHHVTSLVRSPAICAAHKSVQPVTVIRRTLQKCAEAGPTRPTSPFTARLLPGPGVGSTWRPPGPGAGRGRGPGWRGRSG